MDTITGQEINDKISKDSVKCIRLERDYARGDGITRFSTDMPPMLANYVSIQGDSSKSISPEQFRHTVETINLLLEQAERVSFRVVLDNVLELLSLYAWPLLFGSHYQRSLKRLIDFVKNENEKVYGPLNISLSDPVRSAFLFLEFKIYTSASPGPQAVASDTPSSEAVDQLPSE